jgi:hypothetical protein
MAFSSGFVLGLFVGACIAVLIMAIINFGSSGR